MSGTTGSTAGGRAGDGAGGPGSARARLVAGWTLVGIPLLYGVLETVNRASKLFTS
ncbi:hypothetical protein NUM3379_31270 [Kineococcus sp. NUM-3379]